jgi:hypothetical protein
MLTIDALKVLSPAECQVLTDALFFARINSGWDVNFLALEKAINEVRRLAEDRPTRCVPWNDLDEWEHLLIKGRRIFWRGANQRLYGCTVVSKSGGNLMVRHDDRKGESQIYIEGVERIILDSEIVELTRGRND